MLKRLLKKVRYFRFLDNYPELNLGSIGVILLCAFLIVIATFTPLPLGRLALPDDAFIHPAEFFAHVKTLSDIMKPVPYLPQIPAILFIAALIGPRLGLISVFLYILAGLLGFPIFASGGGIQYFTQTVFGYILGYFVAVFLVGNIMSTKVSGTTIFRATIIGILGIHLSGIIYLMIVMLFQHNSLFVIFGEIWSRTGTQITYDIIIGYIAIAFARPVRGLLWVAMD